MRKLICVIKIVEIDCVYCLLIHLVKFFYMLQELMIERRYAACLCHLILIYQLLNLPRDVFVIIPFPHGHILGSFYLDINILPRADQLKQLLESRHFLTLAHIVEKHLLVGQNENVDGFI